MPSLYRRQCPGASNTLYETDAVAFPVLVWTARTAGSTSIGSDFQVLYFFITMHMYNLVRKTENDIFIYIPNYPYCAFCVYIFACCDMSLLTVMRVILCIHVQNSYYVCRQNSPWLMLHWCIFECRL